jgi:hypothetical protein
MNAHAIVDQHRNDRRDMLFAAFLAKQRIDPKASRRRTPRVKITAPITLHMDEWETDTYTLDLSEGGFSFFSSTEPAQQFIPFKLELKAREYVRGRASVVAYLQSGTRYRVCVAFTHLSAEDHQRIADHLLDSMEAEIAS